MSKHTPGPWRAGTWGASVVSDHPIQDGINGSDDIKHYSGHLVAESIAACNMALIIAAPDLLAALQAFERISDIWLPASASEEHEGEMQALHQARNDMLAAIAKATA